MKLLEVHIVPVGISGVRVSDYIYPVFKSLYSRKSSKKAIKNGLVFVDKILSGTGTWISTGKVIELYIDENKNPKNFPLEINVVFENDTYAIIEKPSGIQVNGNIYRTIENALQGNLKLSESEDVLKWPRPVHRLDKPVRGLLLVAKTSMALIGLNKQFQNREIKKRYRSIVIGRLEGMGVIEYPVDGRQAITKFKEIKHYRSLENEWLTLVDLWPITGRKHQLRKHLSKKGYPILGDALYGKEGCILFSKGLFLESVELVFSFDEKKVIYNIKESVKFKTFPEREERRWFKYNR
jgi:23S rRNA pseudouridine1911/1915/1917 synthase